MPNSIKSNANAYWRRCICDCKSCMAEEKYCPRKKCQTLLTSLSLLQTLKVSMRLIGFSPPDCSNPNKTPYFRFFTSALSQHIESLGCPLVLMYYIKMTGIKRPCSFLPSTLLSLPRAYHSTKYSVLSLFFLGGKRFTTNSTFVSLEILLYTSWLPLHATTLRKKSAGLDQTEQ